MTLQSTETWFSSSPKRDSILSITPSMFYLITITPFKVLHYYNNTVCSRQRRFYTTTWYTVLQVLSRMMNFWSMPWLCNEWFHHKNLVSPLTMYISLHWSCALTVVIILGMGDLTSIINKCEALPMMPTLCVLYLLVLHCFLVYTMAHSNARICHHSILYCQRISMLLTTQSPSVCIPSDHHTSMKFPLLY
jgi:hypothetical protein